MAEPADADAAGAEPTGAEPPKRSRRAEPCRGGAAAAEVEAGAG